MAIYCFYSFAASEYVGAGTWTLYELDGRLSSYCLVANFSSDLYQYSSVLTRWCFCFSSLCGIFFREDVFIVSYGSGAYRRAFFQGFAVLSKFLC